MRQFIAKIMVFCLLVISVHTASGGEHTPVHDPEAVSQTQLKTVVIANNDEAPLDEEQMNSECSICHAAHVLLVLAPEGFTFKMYSSRQYDGKSQDMLPSHMDDITHPPIILI
jgi:cytochrome c5